MKPEKKLEERTELKDEELVEVTGGIAQRQTAQRPKQQETKPCIRCQSAIPVNKTPGYCNKCLEEMKSLGVRPFI